MKIRARIKPITINVPYPNTARWDGADIEIDIDAKEYLSIVKRPIISLARGAFISSHLVCNSIYRIFA